jgi:hypothetical protein
MLYKCRSFVAKWIGALLILWFTPLAVTYRPFKASMQNPNVVIYYKPVA